ncbi:hypothetical protein OG607_29795 [Streptomyces sp. NBC_01537]|uniref:hypothetical protein n=1 Tax=Streptomyces sp. NBC_01537 TaxID=2903896 RepID=UPI00386DEA6D
MAEGSRRRNLILAGALLALLLAGAGAGAFALSGRDSGRENGAESEKSHYGLTAPKRLAGGYVRHGTVQSTAVSVVPPDGTTPQGIRVEREVSANYENGSSILDLDGAWGDVYDPGAAVDATMARVQKTGIDAVAAPRLFKPKGLSSDVVVKCVELKLGPFRMLECAWADADTVGRLSVMPKGGSTRLEDVAQLTARVWQQARVVING